MKVLLSIWFVGHLETYFKTPIWYICWQEWLKIRLFFIEVYVVMVGYISACSAPSHYQNQCVNDSNTFLLLSSDIIGQATSVKMAYENLLRLKILEELDVFFFTKLTMFWWNMTAIVLEISQPPKQSSTRGLKLSGTFHKIPFNHKPNLMEI